jgi:hypothetical protein
MRLPADNFSLAANPRYALGSRADSNGVSLFELDHHDSIDVPANLGADAYGDTLALYTGEGELQFYRLGEPQPFRRAFAAEWSAAPVRRAGRSFTSRANCSPSTKVAENWVYTTSGLAPESETAASRMASPMHIFLQPANASSY